MKTPSFIPVPKEPTVEEAKRFASVDHILISVDSTVTREGDSRGHGKTRIDVQKVAVKNESELKPEWVMAGPTRRGEVNFHIAIDAQRLCFSAKTGEAIGSELSPLAAGVGSFSRLPAGKQGSEVPAETRRA